MNKCKEDNSDEEDEDENAAYNMEYRGKKAKEKEAMEEKKDRTKEIEEKTKELATKMAEVVGIPPREESRSKNEQCQTKETEA